MRRSGRVRGSVAAAAVLLVTAACSATEPSVAPSGPLVTPEPTSTAAAPTARDLSDPALGITFLDLPAVDDESVAALEAYQQFEVEYWRSLTTGRLSPGLDAVASPDAAQYVATQVTNNEPDGWQARGGFAVTVRSVRGGTTVVIDACRDLTAITFESPTGTATAADAGISDVLLTRMEMTRAGDLWRVGTREDIGTC